MLEDLWRATPNPPRRYRRRYSWIFPRPENSFTQGSWHARVKGRISAVFARLGARSGLSYGPISTANRLMWGCSRVPPCIQTSPFQRGTDTYSGMIQGLCGAHRLPPDCPFSGLWRSRWRYNAMYLLPQNEPSQWS